jgi:hypothetical protein
VKKPLILGAFLAISFVHAPLWAHDEDKNRAGPGSGAQFGKVHFPISCSPDVQTQFERAVAMLHSFFYPESV